MDEAVAPVVENKSPLKHWPGAWKLFTYSKKAIGLNVWSIIILLVVVTAISGITAWIGQNNQTADALGAILTAIVSLVLGIALVALYLAGIRGQKLDTVSSITQYATLHKVVNVFVASVVLMVIHTVSLVLLVVPFFFVMPRLTLVSYFIVDKDMGPLKSIAASWHATKGNVGKVWGVIGVNIVFSLISLTIIGIPLAIFLLVAYSAAFAYIYEYATTRTAPSAALAE